MTDRPTVENAEIARLFNELAELLELQDANPFRIRAYRNAARVIEEQPEPVAGLAREGVKRLDEIPGIGEDLALKIVEIARTGKLKALAEARRGVPRGLVDLMRVRGLGPRKARALFDGLGIRSLKQLERALRTGKVRELPGFGARSEAKLLEELGTGGAAGERRIYRAVAAQYGEALLEYLRALPGVSRADLAGSFRRARETVGDLDVLVDAKDGAAVGEAFVKYPEVEEVLEQGPTRASVRLRSGLQVDLRVLPAESYGAGLHYFTGSKAHNIAIRHLGQLRGLKISEYGVFRGERRVSGAKEEDVFRAVGLPWMPPEIRENRGELEAAAEGRLPELVALGDIRGDLQMHTTDSDGRDSLEAMTRAAQELGYEYIAVTDHTKAVVVTGGLDRAGFRRQRRRIDQLNRTLRGLTVLASAEVDIHPDGTLDLDDTTLDSLDVVVVSIHSAFDLPERRQTERVLRALDHPRVHVLGHPTGRLIGRRGPMRLQMERIARAAAERGVLLEVNAQPSRLDLDDVQCRAAIEAGARVVISTDAHATAELRFMRWGVDQARRGWATGADVANTRSLAAFRKLLRQ